MAKVQFAIGAEVDIASGDDLRESEDRLFGRLTAERRRGIFRKIRGSVTIPAATYANGVEAVINFGHPADARMWDVRAVTWLAVDYATTIPGFNEGNLFVSLAVGQAPQQVTAVTISDHPAPSLIVVPGVGQGQSFEQPYPVLPDEEAFLYLSATGSTEFTATTVYVATLHVLETVTVAQISGAV